MALDAKGQVVEVGDVVVVRCVIDRIEEFDDYCNVLLKTVYLMPPYVESSLWSLNTKQVELAPKADLEVCVTNDPNKD